MAKAYWDTDRDVLVTPDELHKYYGGMVASGEINPEECGYSDYLRDCLGKNGTLINLSDAIFENAVTDMMEVVSFGIDKLAERYGLETRADDYPDVDLYVILKEVANFAKATLLSALARKGS